MQAPASAKTLLGIGPSRSVVLRLSACSRSMRLEGLRDSEFCRVLVLSAFRREPCDAGRHFLRSERGCSMIKLCGPLARTFLKEDGYGCCCSVRISRGDSGAVRR